MVAGLWLVTLFEGASPAWSLGLGAVGLGITLLGIGIASQIAVEVS
jgi:hypothetical protein